MPSVSVIVTCPNPECRATRGGTAFDDRRDTGCFDASDAVDEPCGDCGAEMAEAEVERDWDDGYEG